MSKIRFESQFLFFLIAEYDKRVERNPKYSVRSFAMQLKIGSSLLSRILKGKIPLTVKMLERFNEHLTIPQEKYSLFYFELERQRSERAKRGVNCKDHLIESFFVDIEISEDCIPQVFKRICILNEELSKLPVNENDPLKRGKIRIISMVCLQKDQVL